MKSTLPIEIVEDFDDRNRYFSFLLVQLDRDGQTAKLDATTALQRAVAASLADMFGGGASWQITFRSKKRNLSVAWISPSAMMKMVADSVGKRFPDRQIEVYGSMHSGVWEPIISNTHPVTVSVRDTSSGEVASLTVSHGIETPMKLYELLLDEGLSSVGGEERMEQLTWIQGSFPAAHRRAVSHGANT